MTQLLMLHETSYRFPQAKSAFVLPDRVVSADIPEEEDKFSHELVLPRLSTHSSPLPSFGLPQRTVFIIHPYPQEKITTATTDSWLIRLLFGRSGTVQRDNRVRLVWKVAGSLIPGMLLTFIS